jgi:hypothetical protein
MLYRLIPNSISHDYRQSCVMLSYYVDIDLRGLRKLQKNSVMFASSEVDILDTKLTSVNSIALFSVISLA